MIAAFYFGALLLSRQANTETPRALMTDLVHALNTQDDGKLRTFLTTYTAPGGPLEERVKRYGDFAKQGGPFVIVADGKETDDEVDAIITDRDHSRLVLRLLIAKKPALLIKAMYIAAAYTVEGPSPKFSHWSSLNELAGMIAKSTKSPGMGIAVLRDRKLEVGVAGVRKLDGKDAIQKDDVWSVGSIGKSLCSSVIGALIDQGKLRWEETLAEAFPDFKMDPGYAKVTVEQIMHHRGGIPEDLGFTDKRVEEIIGDAKTPTEQRANYAKDILSRKPLGAPGQRFAYSNAGYALLSVVAERGTNKPYEQLLHELVFQPLGLEHSYTDIDKLPEARPSGHVNGPNGLEPGDMTGPIEAILAGAGGGIFMSVSDLAKFGEAHMNGLDGKNGFLTAKTVARLHKGIPEAPGGRVYACGWGYENVPTIQPFQGHNGSNGTMRSQLEIFPDANLVVVAIVNCGGEFEPSPGFSAVMAVGQRYAHMK